VLHSGLYYKPGSEKAKLSVNGLQQMVAFCREHGIAHEQCGKIVVATSEDELPRLENLWQRGIANGLQGLRKLAPEQIREIEPHAAGIAAIHVPQEGIVDYRAVSEKLGELIRKNSGEIRLNTRRTAVNELLKRPPEISVPGSSSPAAGFIPTGSSKHQAKSHRPKSFPSAANTTKSKKSGSISFAT
jgi:L-2-hydroxyglutarate oxidase LhgO